MFHFFIFKAFLCIPTLHICLVCLCFLPWHVKTYICNVIKTGFSPRQRSWPSTLFLSRSLRIWSHLLKKSLMENFIFLKMYKPTTWNSCKNWPLWQLLFRNTCTILLTNVHKVKNNVPSVLSFFEWDSLRVGMLGRRLSTAAVSPFNDYEINSND